LHGRISKPTSCYVFVSPQANASGGTKGRRQVRRCQTEVWHQISPRDRVDSLAGWYRRRMRAAPAVSVVLGAAGLLVRAALFFGGGSSDQRVFPVGTAALLLTAAVASAVLAGLLPGPMLTRAGAAFLLLFGGFVVWSGISVRWSIAPDASWDYFNRDLVYLA